MTAFILICTDKPGALELRNETRPAHLAYIESKGASVLLGGAVLDEQGAPAGSVIVIEAKDAAAAQEFANADPYAIAGVFQSVDIKPYRLAAGALLAEVSID